MRFLGAFFLSGLLPALNATAAAQTIPSTGSTSSQPAFEIVALSPDQEGQLTKWFAAIERWQQYEIRWRNRPVVNGWGRVADREPPPAAPDWMAARCAVLSDAHVLDLEPRTAAACRLLDDPRASIVEVSRLDAEKPPKHSSFLTRVHLDALATTSQMGARMYGIVGLHLSLVDVGRVQLFGPPGVLLLTVPAENGERRVTFGYTWGISVRIADIRLNAPTKNMTLFVNVSKVWLGAGDDVAGSRRGYDIVGFSIAPRKPR